MRHRKSGKKLNRKPAHRKAMFRNMAKALLTYEGIRTTEAKAKELRGVVEKLITLALRNDLHSRRLAYKTLNNHAMVQRLFDEIGPRYAGGTGGYTRIIKLSQPRKGDCAPMVLIELTKREGAEEVEAPKKPKAKAKVAKPAEPKAEEPKAEKPKAKKATKAKKAEEPKAEEAPAEEAPAEEAKAEEPPAEEAPAEDAEDKKSE